MAATLLVACTAAVQAFSFEPITQDYATAGPGASHVFRVINTTDTRIAVRISVKPRTVEPDGTEILGKEAEEFVVFPRQMLLEPEERRSVRVRWNGPEAIETELPYRIIAEQIPVDMGGDEPTQGGGIRLTYRYEGSLYVVPPAAEPQVRVAGVERTGDGDALRVRVVNTGNRHMILAQARLVLTRSEGTPSSIELGPGQLAGLAGENVLAGSTRDFVVPAPDDLWNGPVDAEIEFDEE